MTGPTSIDVILHLSDHSPSGIVRIVKRLLPGTAVTKHERDVLSLMVYAIEALMERGDIHKQSGVFVLHQAPEAGEAVVTRFGKSVSHQMNGEPLKRFLAGELMQAGDAKKLPQCAVRYEDDPPAREDER
jgi:hypothetical protein